MKISIIASILILLTAVLIGWQDHQRLRTIRENHARLVAAASALGISFDPSRPEDTIRITKLAREDKVATAKLVAAELIAYYRDAEKFEGNGNSQDQAQQEKMLNIMERMLSLDSSQLKIVLAQITTIEDLKEQTRTRLIHHAVTILAADYPQAALEFLTENSESAMIEGISQYTVASSLSKWAKDDPIKAAEWFQKNSEKFPELLTGDAKYGLISGTAILDPDLAFQLIGKLGIVETSRAFSHIIGVSKTPEQRTNTLAALRKHLATLEDDEAKKKLSEQALSNFASHSTRESFEATSQWVATANLTPEELNSFAGGLQSYSMGEKNGPWIEWIGKNLPPGKASNHIRNMVSNWTQNDYQAAGKWLTALPTGPTKNVAISAYAEQISRYEPENAAQWALTIPAGKDRDTTLESIYHQLPKGDQVAKEAFKQKYGIK